MLRSRLPQIAVELEVTVEKALEESAETVAEVARRRVPVASGKLRDAIHTQSERDGVYVIGGDDEAWYGHLVEHGTSKVAPHPFLVPALEDSRGEVVSHVYARLGRL